MKLPKKILFCRSGGGLPGLDIHCGIWRALTKAGIHATDCIGTSAGAIIGALDAAGYSADDVCRIVSDLRDRDVIRERFAWKTRFMWIEHFCRLEPIRKLLADLLDNHPLRKVFTAVTTRVSDASRVDWSYGPVSHLPVINPPLLDAIMASAAISGIFPWITLNGREYSDGGTRANLPLPGNWRKYDEVWLLIASRPLHYAKRSANVLSRLLLNLDFYAQDQILDVLESRLAGVPETTRIHVVWPQIYAKGGVLHFNHALIEDAEQQTAQLIRGNAL